MKPKLKKFLQAKAHALKPVVIIGQRGLTTQVINEINLALEYHEVIKIRVNAADRHERSTLITEIIHTTAADIVQTIGHVITIYRKKKT